MISIPNRIIKESLRESKAVSSLTDFQFRLWLYLITYVDDYGRGKADPELLASVLFPRIKSITERHVRDGLAALVNKGLIISYVVDGDPYFFFPNWAKHQRIQTKKSKFPAPPDDLSIHGESRCNTVDYCNPPPESNPIQSNTNKNPNPNTNPKAIAFQPPTLEEIIAYAESRDSAVDPKVFYDYFSAGGWTDSKGNPVKNWKQKFITWESKDNGKNKRTAEQRRIESEWDALQIYDN